ncbi:DUF1501 domain-containing protein [Stieleria sp. ICT_E10.1]|uniref:DUF1501 domain-containing protein n=1 Tax=Stieleria sedimenti TaxID=2976331 RepID=UPI00217FC957|nr:DUF1501 domain-containing protein [Stieleria sedimenti]MCS7467307.1 DUF1501 domain-containing protein [Stieleria sedimenti]
MNPFVSRRQLLQSTSLGSIALASLLHEPADAGRAPEESPLSQQSPHFPARVKRVIHLFMNGGPSQMDTFDRKPALNRLDGKPLPDSVKKLLQPTQRNRAGNLFGSPFKFKRYGECGLEVSELFPNVARHADDLCVIRSMQGEIANHTPGLLLTNCGHSTLPRPSLGSWLLYGLGNESDELPGFVVLCPRGLPTAQSRNWTSAFMPGVYQGTHIDTENTGKQIVANLTRDDVRPGSQRAQLGLTQFLNQRHAAQRPGDERLESRIHTMELAFRMQSAGTDAFDLSQEPTHIRELYGETTQGRNMLYARRLAERGVRYIQCYHGGGQPWDNHGSIVRNISRLAKESDQPIAALLTDLKQRGMLDETLVIWGGEMGRTPTVQQVKDPTKVGRDHHIDGYTVWMAGGGVRGGMTYGATDELAMAVTENKVTMPDFHATVLHQLGFDHRRLTYRYSGRDFRLTDVHGRVIDTILNS